MADAVGLAELPAAILGWGPLGSLCSRAAMPAANTRLQPAPVCACTRRWLGRRPQPKIVVNRFPEPGVVQRKNKKAPAEPMCLRQPGLCLAALCTSLCRRLRPVAQSVIASGHSSALRRRWPGHLGGMQCPCQGNFAVAVAVRAPALQPAPGAACGQPGQSAPHPGASVAQLHCVGALH